MSFVSKEKTAPATWKVTAQVSAEDFCTELEKIFVKELPNITLPGFRKGKAPRSMIIKRFGDNLFFEDALEAALPKAIEAALKGAELEPMFRPENLEVQEITKEAGAEFSFSVAVAPEVTIKDYKGIEVEVPSEKVAKKEVDARIDELRSRNAREVEVEGRAAQDGDVAVIDFKGLLDGVAFAGGTAENHELKLGSGQFIPGFEAQVIGHNPGEEFNVEVSFPEEYHAEELAGKPVVFEVKLHELKAEELPVLDDDFAQEVGEDYNTVADLRKGIKNELTESRGAEIEKALREGVQDKLAELVEGEIPEAMFAERTQRNAEMFAERIQIPIEQYCQIMGQDMDSFLASIAGQSQAQIKSELALQAVAAAEGIDPTEEEIEAEYQRLADEYNVELARVKFSVPAEEIKKDVQREKALELVIAAAVKTAAKK